MFVHMGLGKDVKEISPKEVIYKLNKIFQDESASNRHNKMQKLISGTRLRAGKLPSIWHMWGSRNPVLLCIKTQDNPFLLDK